jgi:hypothetical protein
MKSKLYYDPSCPVCKSFVDLIRKKVNLTKVDIIPSLNEKEFKYIDQLGVTYKGESAVNQFSKEFPKILDYFWMLPDGLKQTALTTAYKIGTKVRSIIKKDCNCGKK